MTNPGSNGEVPRKRRSFWTKAALITGCGMMVVGFPVVMFLNAAGILPAANTLDRERRLYVESGALATVREVERAYGVPERENAALILSYLTEKQGDDTTIEFPLDPKAKPGARYSVSWDRFVKDVDKAASLPHFRPARDFHNPFNIGLPELQLLRDCAAEFARRAAWHLDREDFISAEREARRIAILDRWMTDQPFYSSKFTRFNSAISWRELVGRLAICSPQRSEPKQILQIFRGALAREMELDSLGEFLAYSLSRVGPVLYDHADAPNYLLNGGITAPAGRAGSILGELETKAFACGLISPMGGEALQARSYAVGNAFYREWKRSQDFTAAYTKAEKASIIGGPNLFVDFFSNIQPISGFEQAQELIKYGPKVGEQFIDIALWLRDQQQDSSFKIANLRVSALPLNLQTDVFGRSIKIVRLPDRLLIYSFGYDRKDQQGGRGDIALPIPLNPR